MIRTTALLVLLLAGMGAVPHQLVAPHWPDHARVGVWIDPAGAPAIAPPLIDRALAVWTAVSAGHVVLTRASTRDGASIAITFASSQTIYGEAEPLLDPRTGLFAKARVTINVELPGDPIDARIVVYLTALHEMGHALGLPHSDTFEAIMYRFRRPDDGARFFGAYRRRLRSVDDIGTARATGLSEEDVRVLRGLYERSGQR